MSAAPMLIHLPAVATAALTENGWATMVTACGRRGPIRTRESVADSTQGEFSLVASNVCQVCLVLWDWCEERGSFLFLFNDFGASEWKSHGAALRNVVSTCDRCRSAEAMRRTARPIVCIVRDVAQKGVGLK